MPSIISEGRDTICLDKYKTCRDSVRFTERERALRGKWGHGSTYAMLEHDIRIYLSPNGKFTLAPTLRLQFLQTSRGWKGKERNTRSLQSTVAPTASPYILSHTSARGQDSDCVCTGPKSRCALAYYLGAICQVLTA